MRPTTALVAGSLGLSALVAALPLVIVLALLGGVLRYARRALT